MLRKTERIMPEACETFKELGLSREQVGVELEYQKASSI